MRETEKNKCSSKKKNYITPDIQQTEIDNDISLALESIDNENPYEGPEESNMLQKSTGFNHLA